MCHDLISPVGTIVNGLEVLEEEKDEGTKAFALDLIKKSARTASAKLQFCRIAVGAAGSAGAEIDLGDAEAIARGVLEDDKSHCRRSQCQNSAGCATVARGRNWRREYRRHRIQPFYTGLLAKACGVKAAVAMQSETVVVTAQ